MRGGCACAGTYGHYLLDVSYDYSHEITKLINHGDLSQKPGWIRWSRHPTTLDSEIDYFIFAVEEISKNHKKWIADYNYNKRKNEFIHRDMKSETAFDMNKWFTLK